MKKCFNCSITVKGAFEKVQVAAKKIKWELRIVKDGEHCIKKQINVTGYLSNVKDYVEEIALSLKEKYKLDIVRKKIELVVYDEFD